jgi:hypothetical protein
MHGYVYILTNPSFDDIKIGKTSRSVEERVKELDNTSTPTPFEIYGYAYTYKYNELEKTIHSVLTKLTDSRTRINREFFKYPADKAFDLLKELVSLTADGKAILYKKEEIKNIEPKVDIQEVINVKILEETKKQLPPFKFSMIGLKKGDKLTFYYDESIKVEVFDDSKITYKGKIYSMSKFVKNFIPKNLANNSGAYQGPKYFKYNNQILTDLREKANNLKTVDNMRNLDKNSNDV